MTIKFIALSAVYFMFLCSKLFLTLISYVTARFRQKHRKEGRKMRYKLPFFPNLRETKQMAWLDAALSCKVTCVSRAY
jgi:hypothetical protein